MAELFGVNTTLYDNSTPSRFAMPGDQGGVQQVMSDTIELAAASIADTMVMGRIPANCIVSECKMVFDALGASTTLAVGSRDVAVATANLDVNRFIVATDTSSAGVVEMVETEITSGFLYNPTNEQHVYMTLAGGAATGTVKLILTYHII